MKDWKKIGKRLLFPPLWLLAVLTVVCAAALIAVFLRDWQEHPAAYALFCLSAYTVTALTAWAVVVLPGRYRAVKEWVHGTKYGNRYLTDKVFKANVSLYRSLGINLLYVGLNLVSGFLYRSAWFVILACYYTILAVMRFLLVRLVRSAGIGNDRRRELRRARLCGMILLLINLVLSGAVLMILYQGRGYQYPGVLIYVMALYTFYITVHAAVELVRYRKYESPVLTAARVVSLAAALVSMLTLETAMLSQFGTDMSEMNRRILVAATGAGISVVTVLMSLGLIVRSGKELRQWNNNDSET